MSGDASMWAVSEGLAAQLGIFQALLLVTSGLHKLIRRARTQEVMHRFAGVPRPWAPVALFAVAFCELLAALLLCIGALRAHGALLAASIWGVYLALILRAMGRGRRDIDCGCSFGSQQRPLGSFHVTRNALLAATALLVAGVSLIGQGTGLRVAQLPAGFALLALYGALDQVMALQPLRSGAVS